MFAKWIETFVEEKGIAHEILEVEGMSGLNIIPVEALVEVMKSAPAHEQKKIKTMLVKIDFFNGNVLNYFKHLAHAVAL